MAVVSVCLYLGHVEVSIVVSPLSSSPAPHSEMLMKKGLMLEEKSVPSPDQDVITMSVQAARYAIKRAGIDPKKIGNIYIGSESHPYAVKPSGTIVAEAIGATLFVTIGLTFSVYILN